jgi:hypothetical protein
MQGVQDRDSEGASGGPAPHGDVCEAFDRTGVCRSHGLPSQDRIQSGQGEAVIRSGSVPEDDEGVSQEQVILFLLLM